MHVVDAAFDDAGLLLDYTPMGAGVAQIERQIELLRGVVYDGYLVFEWPRLWDDSPPEPDRVLPDVVKFLRGSIEAKQTVLTAFKNDKRAVKLTSRKPVCAGN